MEIIFYLLERQLWLKVDRLHVVLHECLSSEVTTRAIQQLAHINGSAQQGALEVSISFVFRDIDREDAFHFFNFGEQSENESDCRVVDLVVEELESDVQDFLVAASQEVFIINYRLL